MSQHLYIATLVFGPANAPTHTQEFPFKSGATRTGTLTTHARHQAEAALGTDDFLVTAVRAATLADFENPAPAKKVVRVEELPAEMQVRIALEPVLCIDCNQYVPNGWINNLAVKCSASIGATGVQYGHRVPREVPASVVDMVVNLYVREGRYDLSVGA